MSALESVVKRNQALQALEVSALAFATNPVTRSREDRRELVATALLFASQLLEGASRTALRDEDADCALSLMFSATQLQEAAQDVRTGGCEGVGL